MKQTCHGYEKSLFRGKNKNILKIDTDTENQFLVKVGRYFKDKNVDYATEIKGKTKSNAYEQLLKRFESIYKTYHDLKKNADTVTKRELVEITTKMNSKFNFYFFSTNVPQKEMAEFLETIAKDWDSLVGRIIVKLKIEEEEKRITPLVKDETLERIMAQQRQYDRERGEVYKEVDRLRSLKVQIEDDCTRRMEEIDQEIEELLNSL